MGIVVNVFVRIDHHGEGEGGALDIWATLCDTVSNNTGPSRGLRGFSISVQLLGYIFHRTQNKIWNNPSRSHFLEITEVLGLNDETKVPHD